MELYAHIEGAVGKLHRFHKASVGRGSAEGQPRTPTVSFTLEGYAPEQVTEVFGSKGINSWHGDFYAVEAVAALGLAESGGLIRLGMAPDCTESDIDRVLNTVAELARNR